MSAHSAAAADAKDRFKIIGFTKPFQDIGFEQTAKVVAEIGWTGIECPVRAKGQVLPERVEEDLPRLHEALQKNGLDLTLATTDIHSVDPLNERVLRTAAKLGVRRYRLGPVHYDLKKPIPPQLANYKAQLRDLAALNKDLGVAGGLQNHSGGDYIGAPVWDIYELVHDIDPEHLGCCFDICHATIEGGLCWPVHARLMEPFFVVPYVKDFYWKKTETGWVEQVCPLGEGMVHAAAYFAWLKSTSYSGPISHHIEFQTGAGPEEVRKMREDCGRVKALLA
ncbi:MAG TPA: sugar phosphate isomerase/epimerase family protein [Chthoniobacteraceae bacterium]